MPSLTHQFTMLLFSDMENLTLEEKIELFETAAENVDTYEDNRVYSYATKVRLLIDSIMMFETIPSDPLDALQRLEAVLRILEEKIQKKQNYQLVIRQAGLDT